MNQGLMYIAFGKDYDHAAAESVKYLRRVSNIDVHVVSNIVAEKRSLLWADVSNVSFRYLAWPDNRNRIIKTMPTAYSPFGATLYVDCDTLIHSVEFEEAFKLLKYCDVAFPIEVVFPVEGRITRLYKEAMAVFGCEYPLVVYHGGVCAFNSSQRATLFFTRWQQAWRLFGERRDMPPLACMAQKIGTDATIAALPSDFGARDGKVVQHVAGDAKSEHMTRFKKNKPFDKKGQWKWEPA